MRKHGIIARDIPWSYDLPLGYPELAQIWTSFQRIFEIRSLRR